MKFLSFLLVASNSILVSGFTSPASGTLHISRNTALRSTTTEERTRYSEESRKLRRTVYTHDDWVKHRSPDRFLNNLQQIPTSGVYRVVSEPLLIATGIASFVCLYNIIVGGYTDFSGVDHAALINLPKVGLPTAPLTLSSSALGLLLVFRTNASYNRWDEARKNWGMNINHTRDLVRLANAYYDSDFLYDEEDRKDPSKRMTPEEEAQKREEDLKKVALATWSFVRAMKRHLSPEWEDEEDFKKELFEKLPPKQAQAILDAAHRPNRALFDLSVAIERLPMHFLRKNEIQAAVTIFEDNLGSSERILTSPVPLAYSRHSTRFLCIWLFFMPLALYEPFKASWNHIGMIPATSLIALFFLGIDELATQLKEPFTILPMQAFCDKIYNWCTEIVSWTPNDTGVYDE